MHYSQSRTFSLSFLVPSCLFLFFCFLFLESDRDSFRFCLFVLLVHLSSGTCLYIRYLCVLFCSLEKLLSFLFLKHDFFPSVWFTRNDRNYIESLCLLHACVFCLLRKKNYYSPFLLTSLFYFYFLLL
jgi:hypothetical protein